MNELGGMDHCGGCRKLTDSSERSANGKVVVCNPLCEVAYETELQSGHEQTKQHAA